ncbi:hypothetical protein QOZ80_7BG0591200 [Eleusine coracana subsp. coracana]|nr:hypothetical protein QOZ80_7BG0591200 [Eleusine coracana subsp. coracana]
MTRSGADRCAHSPGGDQSAALLGDDMAAFRAALGADFTVADAVYVLSCCSGDTERAIRSLLDTAAANKGWAGGGAPVPGRRARGVKADGAGSGAVAPSLSPRPVKVEPADEGEVKVKMEPICADFDGVKVKGEAEALGEVEAKLDIPGESGIKVKPEPVESDGSFQEQARYQEEADEDDVKEEADGANVKEEEADKIGVKKEEQDDSDVSEDEPVRALPPPGAVPTNEWRMVVAPLPAELEQYPPDHCEWHLFKKSYATGLSTCRGRKLLDAGEVVHFAFPSYDWLYGRARVSARQATALAEIVRFSTNRSGEIGKLSPVWAKCLAPLVSSSKVLIQGKMVFPMVELRLMQEVLLYVSFYVNRSCLYLIDPENARHPDNPLRPLFKLLKRFGESQILKLLLLWLTGIQSMLLATLKTK